MPALEMILAPPSSSASHLVSSRDHAHWSPHPFQASLWELGAQVQAAWVQGASVQGAGSADESHHPADTSRTSVEHN